MRPSSEICATTLLRGESGISRSLAQCLQEGGGGRRASGGRRRRPRRAGDARSLRRSTTTLAALAIERLAAAAAATTLRELALSSASLLARKRRFCVDDLRSDGPAPPTLRQRVGLAAHRRPLPRASARRTAARPTRPRRAPPSSPRHAGGRGSQTDASGRARGRPRAADGPGGAWREVGDVLLRAVLAGCDATVLAVGRAAAARATRWAARRTSPASRRARCGRVRGCARTSLRSSSACSRCTWTRCTTSRRAASRARRSSCAPRPPASLAAGRRRLAAGAPAERGGRVAAEAAARRRRRRGLARGGQLRAGGGAPSVWRGAAHRPPHLPPPAHRARAHALLRAADEAERRRRRRGDPPRRQRRAPGGRALASVVAAHAVDPLWRRPPPARRRGAAAEGDGDNGDGDGDDGDGHREEWQARLCFVQLAGLERLEAGGGQGLPPVALREALSIQSSTAALSAALQAAARRDHATPATKTAPPRARPPAGAADARGTRRRALLVSVVALGPPKR